MVKKYRKGYVAERELMHRLYGLGWAVMRAPHSGSMSIASPDIVAIKQGKVIVIECKSRAAGFTISKEQLEDLAEWEKRAGAIAFVGWKIAHKGWFFFRLGDVKNNNGNVGKKLLQEKGFPLNDLN